jgi:hypothetical protein
MGDGYQAGTSCYTKLARADTGGHDEYKAMIHDVYMTSTGRGPCPYMGRDEYGPCRVRADTGGNRYNWSSGEATRAAGPEASGEPGRGGRG